MLRLPASMDKFSQMLATGVQLNTAVYQFFQMINIGISCPHIVLFSSMINNLWKEGQVIYSHDIVDLIIYIVERPDIITSNPLIVGYCIVSNIEKAFGDCSGQMVKKNLQCC